MDVLPLSEWLARPVFMQVGTPENLGRYSIAKAGQKSSFMPSAHTDTAAIRNFAQLLSFGGLDTLRSSLFRQAISWPALKIFFATESTEEHGKKINGFFGHEIHERTRN
ncbi:MAG: hypothetical protein R6T87_02590 [Marinobacter sp.]